MSFKSDVAVVVSTLTWSVFLVSISSFFLGGHPVKKTTPAKTVKQNNVDLNFT
jgi:hypothetical protein